MNHISIHSHNITLDEGLRNELMKTEYLVSEVDLTKADDKTAIQAFKNSLDAEIWIDDYCYNNDTDKPNLFVYKVLSPEMIGWTPQVEEKYRNFFENDDDGFWKRRYKTFEAMMESVKKYEEEVATSIIYMEIEESNLFKKNNFLGVRFYLLPKEIDVQRKRVVSIR